MRVAYVAFAPFVSGAERSLQIMLLSAPNAGIDPIVLCPPGSKIIPWCRENNVRYVTAPLPDRDKWHAIRWFSSVYRVARILRRERIDLVHSNQVWSMATAGAAARLVGIPRVCHMRDEVATSGTLWWCKSGVEAVVCISHHIERQVAPAWASKRRRPRIQTLLNPVVVTAVDPIMSANIAPDTHTQREARARLGLNESAIVFGFIGQIVAVKGVLELLGAVAQITDPRWHLVIAGRDPHPGAPYEAECRLWVDRLGLKNRVTFLGFLENTRDFYESIDVAVVPSLEEPLGRIPLETASYGKPTIAFATGGLPETIVDGKTGWLVPTGDVNGLRTALAATLADPEILQTAGKAARTYVVEHCSPDGYMRQLATLYKELLTAKRASILGVAPPSPTQSTAGNTS